MALTALALLWVLWRQAGGVGLGIALAMFCTIVALDHPEDELQALLIRTDKMRKAQKAAGGGTTTMA